MQYTIVLLSTLFNMLFFGCNNSESVKPTPVDTSVILPLKIGNSWHYKSYEYDTTGKLTDTWNIYYQVIDQFYVGYNLVSKMKITNDLTNDTMYLFYFNKADGCYWGFYDSSVFKSVLYYKYPGKAGDIWKLRYGSVKIISINETFTCPAGSFNCYKYDMNPEDSTSRNFDFLAPGIGLVGNLFYNNNLNYGKVELISYSLK